MCTLHTQSRSAEISRPIVVDHPADLQGSLGGDVVSLLTKRSDDDALYADLTQPRSGNFAPTSTVSPTSL